MANIETQYLVCNSAPDLAEFGRKWLDDGRNLSLPMEVDTSPHSWLGPGLILR